jgi:hypothetical protein
MKRKLIIILLSCVCVSITIVGVLYAFSIDKSNHHNGFTRLIQRKVAIDFKILDLKYDSYYIAGITADHIYLGNSTASLHLLKTNSALTDTQHIVMKIKDINKLKLKSLQTKVDPPYFYFMDILMPGILRGQINTWVADTLILGSEYFTSVVPISEYSLALRSINRKRHENELKKKIIGPAPSKAIAKLLEKQIDGVFCTDGMLHYNSQLNKIIYLYYYRNQYIVMDTNLNLVHRGNTIDTIKRAQIKVASIRSQNSKTMATPPLKVNKQSCTSGNLLFINSSLLADNETKLFFDNASVIDVYDLKNYQYKFSFYLRNHENKKMREFRIYNNILIALYDHYLIKYDLNIQD